MSTIAPSIWNSPEQYIVQSILQNSYPEFIMKLGKNVNDPKFIAAIRLLSNLRKVNYKTLEIPVTKLIPSQNEIDLAKSLSFPLNDPFTTELFLNGGIIAVAGRKIVTSNDGKFIIDGHHRWSQVYCINPEAMILSVDLSDIKNPFHALEYTQMGIAADIGQVPTAIVQGVNMLTSTKDQVYDYIEQNIKPAVIDVFIKKGIVKSNISNTCSSALSQIQGYIWYNVRRMQINNKPVNNAPVRNLMPQTDFAPGWLKNAPFIEKYKYT